MLFVYFGHTATILKSGQSTQRLSVNNKTKTVIYHCIHVLFCPLPSSSMAFCPLPAFSYVFWPLDTTSATFIAFHLLPLIFLSFTCFHQLLLTPTSSIILLALFWYYSLVYHCYSLFPLSLLFPCFHCRYLSVFVPWSVSAYQHYSHSFYDGHLYVLATK